MIKQTHSKVVQKESYMHVQDNQIRDCIRSKLLYVMVLKYTATT